ncbi:hypothetical protein ElyMa_000969600 [Elysia marginata]|uniref:Uncharacterized protein n=1 Tax=Elysia marginata TaxID=1093978 RepID=A0AAV4HF26_9GAST|nr:hypothetical protein ElyMa_000969600 [Elysia marginata]
MKGTNQDASPSHQSRFDTAMGGTDNNGNFSSLSGEVRFTAALSCNWYKETERMDVALWNQSNCCVTCLLITGLRGTSPHQPIHTAESPWFSQQSFPDRDLNYI